MVGRSRCVTTAEKLNSDDPAVALGLGLALRELDEFEQAAEKLIRYTSIQSNDGQGPPAPLPPKNGGEGSHFLD